jgi:hypothetical protein
MKIELTREQFEAKRALCKADGFDLQGDSGTVGMSGVELTYSYNGKELDIEVTKKPLIIRRSYIEAKVYDWFTA